MPDPGSHANDVKRTRPRAEYDDTGTPDQHADQAANERLQENRPPRRPDDRRAVAVAGPEGHERAAGPLGARRESPGSPAVGEPASAAGGLVLRSPAFADHAPIPSRHARDGEQVRPPLEWSQVPDGTAELALLCEDLDAPGGAFTHWVVTAIPPEATGIDESGLPAGAREGRNDFGERGWGGPRPPVGDEPHRYAFRLYALDQPLGLRPDATGDELRGAVAGRLVATGTLVGLFAR